MRIIIIRALALALLLAVAPTMAGAQYQPQNIGEFRDWTAWLSVVDGKKTCFAASTPQKSLPKGVRRGEIFFYVSHRPRDGVRGEVSARVGYPFAAGKQGRVIIGDRRFTLQFSDERGWPKSPAEDKRIVAAMKAGSAMAVSGVSARGTKTSDTYSLLGFTAAYNAISKACK